MTTLRTKRLLHAATIASLLASVAVLVWASRTPLSVSTDDADSKSGSAATATSRPSQVPPLSSFAAAWSRDLRQPLDDVPRPAATIAAQASSANVNVRLVGTIIDPARPRGIFMTQLGQMELRGVGEKAGGAEILQIDERSATVSISGRPVVLKLEKVEFTVPVNPSASIRDKNKTP